MTACWTLHQAKEKLGSHSSTGWRQSIVFLDKTVNFSVPLSINGYNYQ